MRLEGDDLRQSEAIGDLLQSLLAGNEVPAGSVVARWVAVIDVMTPDGERELLRLHSDGATRWELAALCREGEEGWGE